jgi:hypothetical protein
VLSERGSVLALVPALLLVVLLLGSLAVDRAVVFLFERELHALAASAANDAAAAGVDASHLRATGEFRLDSVAVAAVAERTIGRSSREIALLHAEVAVTAVDGLPAVRVELRGRATYVLAAGVPGLADGTDVEASAIAVAARP